MKQLLRLLTALMLFFGLCQIVVVSTSILISDYFFFIRMLFMKPSNISSRMNRVPFITQGDCWSSYSWSLFLLFFPTKWRLREFFKKSKLATFSSMIIIGGWLLEIWVKQDKLVTSTQRLLSWKWNRAKSKSLRLLSHRVHYTLRVHIIYVTSWIISFLSFFFTWRAK